MVIAVLLNPNNPQAANQVPEIKAAALELGLQINFSNASTAPEIDNAYSAIVQQRTDALIIGADTFFLSRRDQIVALAARYAIPTIYSYREFIAAGGLMSYGTDLADAYRQEGDYVGRILHGVKPDDLPVQQSVKIELLLNLKAAKALGLSFPLTLLGRADETIE
jgi:putative ABC transport system substrate-binding protein